MADLSWDELSVTNPTELSWDSLSDKPPESKARGIGGFVKDTGLDLAKGVVGLGESVVGLGNLASFGMLGKAAESVGYDPKQTSAFLAGLQSDARQKSDREVADTKGFWNTLGALGTHPDVLFGNIVESLPGTVGAGAVGGMLVKRLAATAATEATALGLTEKAATDFIAQKVRDQTFKIAAAASGAEGAQTAGSIAESGRQAGKDWSDYVAPALAAGLGTAAIGMVSGKIGQKLGIGDVETDIAARTAGVKGVATSQGGAFKRIGGEMLKEGALEEMPQSYQEQAFQNLATGKPWQEGTSEAAAQGLMAGAGMAGGHAVLTGRAEPKAETPPPAPTPDPLRIGNTPDPMIGFPDGTVARRSEVEAYINSLPEDQRVAARAKLQGLEKQPAKPDDILKTESAADAISTFMESVSKTGQDWQNLGVTPTGETSLLSSYRAGQEWQSIAPEQAGSLEQQRAELEREGAALSQARDARLASIGQEWQDLGITSPADDLQAQRMGMREEPNGVPPSVLPADSGRNGQDGNLTAESVGAGVGADGPSGVQPGELANDPVGEPGEYTSKAPASPVDERLVPKSKRNVQNAPQAPASGTETQTAPDQAPQAVADNENSTREASSIATSGYDTEKKIRFATFAESLAGQDAKTIQAALAKSEFGQSLAGNELEQVSKAIAANAPVVADQARKNAAPQKESTPEQKLKNQLVFAQERVKIAEKAVSDAVDTDKFGFPAADGPKKQAAIKRHEAAKKTLVDLESQLGALNTNVQNNQAPTARAQAQEAPAVEAPKGGVYTLTDAISADGPVSETVRLIVRPDGSSAIQRENGDVIDVTNMIRAGFSAERAIAQSLGDDTSGKNVSRNEQNPPKKPEPKAKAPAVEARAPVAGDAAGAVGVSPAGSAAKVQPEGVKAGDFVKLSAGDDQRVRQVESVGDDGWVYTKSGEAFKPGQFEAADKPVAKPAPDSGRSEVGQAYADAQEAVDQFRAGNRGWFSVKRGASTHSGVMLDSAPQEKRDQFNALVKDRDEKLQALQPTQPITGEGAGVAKDTAEAKIRATFDAEPRTVGKWHPITIEHNGVTQSFLANQVRVVSDGKRDGTIHLINVRKGRMLKGDPLEDLAYSYKLDGKNNLVEEGLPKKATDEQKAMLSGVAKPKDPRTIKLSQRTESANAQTPKAIEASPPAQTSQAEVSQPQGNATSAPGLPGIYKLANGSFARFQDGIWYRGEDTPKKALHTEMAASAMKATDRTPDQNWEPHSGFTLDAYGATKALKPLSKTDRAKIAEQNQPPALVNTAQPAIESVAEAGPVGRNNVPLSEGGKPYKTKLGADTARKTQPMMRVQRVAGGYALIEKTPAQIAAQEKAAKRLSQPRTSPKGEPIPAHAMIAAAGGLHPNTRADMGMQGNVNVGNRKLFAGVGRGLTIEQATEKLIEEGYLQEGAGHDQARALIKRSLTNPQYTPEGTERMAEKELQEREKAFNDEQEALALAQEADDTEYEATVAAFEAAMLNEPQAEAQGDMSMEDALLAAGYTKQEIDNERSETEAIGPDAGAAGALAQNGQGAAEAAPGRGAQGDAGRDGAAREDQGSGEGLTLTAPSRQEVLAQQAAIDAEAKRKEEGGDKPIPRKQLTGDIPDLFNPQGSVFDVPEEPEAQKDAGETPFTYINGDRAEYTGKTESVAGALFYEVRFTEGRKAGETGATARAPDGTNPLQQGPIEATGIVTPQLSGNPEKFIKVAADSVDKLRQVDVERVLSETPVHFRAEVSAYIKSNRAGLSDEVDAVMADLNEPAQASQTEPKREFRNPDNLNVLHAPIEDKDWFKLKNGEEWQARQGYSGRGWSLVRNGNLHPEARNFDSQSDFIRSVIDVTGQTQASGQVAAPVKAKSEKEYRYAMVNRPVDIGTAPKDGLIRTEERPVKGAEHHDMARNGVAVYNRELTDAETKQFEMAPMSDADQLGKAANLVAQDMTDYAEQYVEMHKENRDEFVRKVSERLKGTATGYAPSVGSMDKFADLVASKLANSAKPITTAIEANDEPIPAVTEAQARKQFEWRNMGQKDGTKSHLLFFFESEKDKGTGAAMNRGEVSLYPGASGWKVEDGDGTSYKSLADAKKAAIDLAIPKLQDQGYILKPAQAATAILDAANVTGKERIDALKDVKKGDITPEELQAAYPASAGKFEQHNAIANEYGYVVAADGTISLASGKESGLKVVPKGSRFQIRSKTTDAIVYSGGTVDSMGKFLESFWGAEKTPTKPDNSVKPEARPDSGGILFSRGETQNPTTVSALQSAIKDLLGTFGTNKLGRIVATTAAEIKSTWEPLIGKTNLESEGNAGKAQAFFDPKTNTVFLIADNIEAGTETAVLAHELMHKHGKSVLGEAGWNKLHSVISSWANAKEGSQERQVYDQASAAVERVGAELSTEELFPYAVEAAIKMGIKPDMGAKQGTVARWLESVRQNLKMVWAKITNKPETFKAQDLVNLAFGIAQRENPEYADGMTNPDVVGNQGGRSADDNSPGAAKHPFAGFTREKFLGNPKITSDANARDLVPSTWKSLESVQNVPFAIGDGFTARFSELSAAVYNAKGEVVASYSSGDTLVVNKKYRRQGIGSELVYQWRMKNPNSKTAQSRTKKSQALQEKLWDRIRSERALYEARAHQNESTATNSNGAFARKVDQTESEAFKRWFGDSKVVDSTGKPMVVYHGTTKDFGEFASGTGYFTADQFEANMYGGFNEAGANVMPAYLSIKNPRVIESETMTGTPRDVIADAMTDGSIDGVIVTEGGKVRWAVVTEPTQIKSAIGNNGDFDGENPDIRFSRSQIIGQTNRQHTPEQLRAMKNVGFQIEVPTLKERAQALYKDAGKKLTQGIVDQFAPVKDLDKNAYGLLRLAKGASGAFESFLKGGKLKITDGVYDFDDANKGGVVDKLLIPLGGEHHDFMRWVAANRAERLQGEGRENLFSPQDIADLKTLANGTTDFDYTIQTGPTAGRVTRDRTLIYADANRVFNEFNKNILDMAEQSGLIDGASRKVWEHEFYVPFYRVADEDGGGVRGMSVKGSVLRQQAFKELKGGKNALNADLLDNTLMNWAHLLDAAAKNRAAKATIEAAERMGVATGGNQSILASMGASVNNKNGVVWFMDGGIKRYSLIDNQGDGPFIMTAINALEYAGMRNPVMNAMGTMKHVLTVGVTASPFFKIRNLIRDSVQVIGTSGINPNPAVNIGQGWKLTNPKSDAYFRLLAGGGTIHFGTMLEGSEAKRVQALVESGVKDSTILNSEHKVKAFYRKFIEPGITAYNELGNRGEAINRASLYDQLRKQGVNHADASLQARDLMDFSMQGSFTSIRFLTQVVPFLNARLQGLYKLGRAAKEDPARFSMVLGTVAAISLGLLAAYSDDDDWKKREEWDRNNFWWFKVGGTAFRIPKPFEIGAIATLAERGFERAFDKEMTNKRFMNQVTTLLGDNLSMNPVPQLVKPMLDVYSNKDSFSGRPIETMSMERLKSEYRFTDRTSMTARAASTSMNAVTGLVGKEALSPVQIDHMLRGYFGWLGAFIVGSADKLARPLTDQKDQASPDYWKVATGGMVSELSDAPSRYVSAMYEQAKTLEEAYGTYRMLVKEGRIEEAKDFMTEHKDELSNYKRVENVKKAEAKFNERIRMIERSAMDSDAKRDAIRKIKEQKDRVARQLAPI